MDLQNKSFRSKAFSVLPDETVPGSDIIPGS